MYFIQFAFAPLLEEELGMFCEFEAADFVHQLAKFFASDPREGEDVHPNFNGNPYTIHLHSIACLNLIKAAIKKKLW